MSSDDRLFEKLSDKEYRDAYVASLTSVTIPMQIRALRESRKWSQTDLAKATGMKQPRISALESASDETPNLRTLLRIASAFDIGLLVWFVPFSELVKWDSRFSTDKFVVPSHGADVELQMASGRGSSGFIPFTQSSSVAAAITSVSPQTSALRQNHFGGLCPTIPTVAAGKITVSTSQCNQQFSGDPVARTKAA